MAFLWHDKHVAADVIPCFLHVFIWLLTPQENISPRTRLKSDVVLVTHFLQLLEVSSSTAAALLQLCEQ